jgi:hypothetical protein
MLCSTAEAAFSAFEATMRAADASEFSHWQLRFVLLKSALVLSVR